MKDALQFALLATAYTLYELAKPTLIILALALITGLFLNSYTLL